MIKKERILLIFLIALLLVAAIFIPLSCPGQNGEATEPSASETSALTTRSTTTTTRTTTVTTTPVTEPTDNDPELPEEDENFLADIYEQIAPSVVSIHVTIPASSLYAKREEFFTGLIVDESGIIVTTYSLFERALDYRGELLPDASIDVTIRGTHEALPAKLLGYHSTVDLAIIKVQEQEELSFPAVTLAKNPELAIGAPVYMIGYPPALIRDGGLAIGYITSLYRAAIEEDGSPLGLLETSIPTFSVYAGSPLINRDGEIVALTSAYLRRIYVQHQGYAVPSPVVLDVIDRILHRPEGAPERRAALGITVLADEEMHELSERFGYPKGLYIDLVKPESAAYTAGLNAGDILLSINGQVMEETKDLLSFMDGQVVGALMEMTVFRPSDEQTLVKTCFLLEERP